MSSWRFIMKSITVQTVYKCVICVMDLNRQNITLEGAVLQPSPIHFTQIIEWMQAASAWLCRPRLRCSPPPRWTWRRGSRCWAARWPGAGGSLGIRVITVITVNEDIISFFGFSRIRGRGSSKLFYPHFVRSVHLPHSGRHSGDGEIY